MFSCFLCSLNRRRPGARPRYKLSRPRNLGPAGEPLESSDPDESLDEKGEDASENGSDYDFNNLDFQTETASSSR